MTKDTFSQEDLETFKWDEPVPGVDFFSEVGTQEPEKKEEGKSEEEDKPEDKTEETVDLFGETSKEQESTEEVDRKEEEEIDKPNNEKISNLGVANFLKEKGIIDFELEEGEELDELDAEQLIEDSYEEAVERRLGETISELPDSVKNLVKFVSKGGDPDEYFAQMSAVSSEGISKNLDITNEDNQVKFMKFQLKQDGFDDEYIDFQIETMKDSGRLESMSSKAFTKWKKEQDEKDSSLLERQKEAIEKQRQAQLKYRRDLGQKLSETESINNLKFSKQDIKELPDYISTANVTLEDGRKISPFYRDLFEYVKDPEKVLVIAKLIKGGLDFKDIEKNVITKQTKEVKQDLQRQKDNKRINSAEGSSQPKRLADYFPD